jgi:hypothetical protein
MAGVIVMTEDARKAAVLALEELRSESKVTPKQFVTALTNRGVREDTARVTMWDLIDQRRVTLSPDRILTLTKTAS